MYAEQRLIEKLFQNYEPSVRPYINISEPVHTSFGVSLVNILELVSCLSDLMIAIVQRSFVSVVGVFVLGFWNWSVVCLTE